VTGAEARAHDAGMEDMPAGPHIAAGRRAQWAWLWWRAWRVLRGRR
jgi:hypothetical protein